MSTIACLGWGSLIWHQGNLPIVGDWQPDGPSLPLEFARQSTEGTNADALTLVLVPGPYPLARSLWSYLDVKTPAEAREVLGTREKVPEKYWKKSIALWEESDKNEPANPAVASWARDRGLSAVVWTALPPKFQGENRRMPTLDEAVIYLRGLTGEPRERAERYVRKAPAQIDTPYRQRFVAEFEWAPI
jgi:hypothetical protein